MPTYKLYYFDGRGRVELARLIFTPAGEKYEDIRYERSEWPSHKSEMPVLEVDGVKLPQSMTIARFLAKRFGLDGRDDLEQAKVDAVVDTSIDLALKFVPIHMDQDENTKTAGMKKFLVEELPKHLQNLEALGKLYSNESSFFVGNHLT